MAIYDDGFGEIDESEVSELNASGVPLSGKIALVDADTVAYTTALSCQEVTELMPRDFYSNSEWEEIVHELGYDEEAQTVSKLDMEVALEAFESKLQSILDSTGCEEYDLAFTGGRTNFRYAVHPEYKANRKGLKAPFGLSDLKKAITDKLGGVIYINIEADDYVVSIYNSDKHILCAIDKDVLNNVVGKHWNYLARAGWVHPKSGNYIEPIAPKWVETDMQTSLKYPYWQCLVGDTSDGIAGLHRVGPKTADKLLAKVTTEKECWDMIVAQYLKKGKTEQDAITTMRLVNMYQYEPKSKTINLWEPHFD